MMALDTITSVIGRSPTLCASSETPLGKFSNFTPNCICSLFLNLKLRSRTLTLCLGRIRKGPQNLNLVL
ncbi:unnamed protein product [Malus baccata var. baccata]